MQNFFNGAIAKLSYLLYAMQQVGQIILNCFPDDIRVNLEIPVSDYISHSDNSPPVNIRIFLLNTFRDSVSSLSYNKKD